MGAHNSTNSSGQVVKKVSCAVKLGQTHVLCTLVKSVQNSLILNRSKPLVSLSLTLIKDSSLNLRRDLIEEKEAQIKQSLMSKIEKTINESPSKVFEVEDGSSHPCQLSFTFSVVSDDGNLPSVLVAGSSDMLCQLTNGQSA